MKYEQQDLFNTEWKIEHFKLIEEEKYNSIYESGGVLTFRADRAGEVAEIGLKIAGSNEFTNLPPFMGIKPSYFENDGIQYVVVIIGSDPCELHRLIIWFGGFGTSELWFKFKVASIYDDCVCPEEDDEEDAPERLRSGHGIGGGTGGDRLEFKS